PPSWSGGFSGSPARASAPVGRPGQRRPRTRGRRRSSLSGSGWGARPCPSSGPDRGDRPGAESPSARQNARIPRFDQPASAQPVVSDDDGLHLVEEELFGHAAEEGKGRLEPTEQGAHVLLLVEAHPKQARVAEHDQERMPLAPGEAKLGKVHLGLAARRRLEADSHLLGRLWPHLAYVVAKLRVAARIAQSPDLLQQPDRREGGIGEKALADDLLEGIELL